MQLEEYTPQEMVKWIKDEFDMSLSRLAWMFQTSKSTVHYWLYDGKMTHKHESKIRKSFFYLHSKMDPHFGQRHCYFCNEWQPESNFRKGKAVCRQCEYKKRKNT